MRRPQQGEETVIPPWIEYMDHTADAGIVVRAGTLPELYSRAAWGMCSLLTDMSTVRPETRTTVSVEATDREALMVRWLSELNFRHITQRTVFGVFDVRRVDETRLEAEVGGESIRPDRHIIFTEIKAVTYHLLEVAPESQGWRARVVFDL